MKVAAHSNAISKLHDSRMADAPPRCTSCTISSASPPPLDALLNWKWNQSVRVGSALALGLTLFAAIATPAWAQFAKPEDAIKYRQSVFTVIAAHFSQISAVVKGEKPFNAAEVANNAALVETLAKLPWNAFPAGSETGTTKAKPEIWQESDKFKAAAEKLQAETVKLSAAAKTGDLAQIKSAFGAVGQSCKACHDSYKSK